MTELERFVSRLVDALRIKDPAGVHRPVTVRDVRLGLLPYRVHRNALRLTNGEDYDLLLLRLCAEEGGFVRTNPPDAAARCRDQVASPNPDLTMVAELDQVTVQIGAEALQRIERLEADLADRADPAAPVQAPSDLPFLPLDAPEPPAAAEPMLEEPLVAPPEPGVSPGAMPLVPPPPSEPESPARVEASLASSDRVCPHCLEPLPRGRRAAFCPHCGERVSQLRCSRCGTELEPGWRHCITCGQPARSGGAYA